MSGYQFIHIEAYSFSGSKGLPGNPAGKTKTARTGRQARLSIKQVVDEVLRKDGACPHVAEPKPPVMIHGDDLEASIADLEQRAASAKDSLGRKLRKDKLLLLAGVASYPVPISNLDENDERFLDWGERTEDFLRARWGDQLQAIVYHRDETYPHLHFYVLPSDLDMASIHPGVKAGQEAPPNQSKAAYNAAMREFQNDYFDQVGQVVGLTRLGPGRRRLTRGEWKTEQATASLTADCLQRRDTELAERQSRLELERRQFLIAKSGLALEKGQVAAQDKRLREESASLKSSHAVLALKETSILVHAVRELQHASKDSETVRLRRALAEKDAQIAELSMRLLKLGHPPPRFATAPESNQGTGKTSAQPLGTIPPGSFGWGDDGPQ